MEETGEPAAEEMEETGEPATEEMEETGEPDAEAESDVQAGDLSLSLDMADIQMMNDMAQSMGVQDMTDLLDTMRQPPAPVEPVAANWNEEISQIFDIQPQIASPKATPRKSKAISSHQLLTSEELIQEKKAALEKKQRDEAAKQERKEKALQKRMEKANKKSKNTAT